MPLNKIVGFGISSLVSLLLFGSCKKLIDVQPPITTVVNTNVYGNDASAISAITSIYANMSFGGLDGNGMSSLSLLSSLSADELTLFSGNTNSSFAAYYSNTLTYSTGNDFWSVFYPPLYTINEAIEQLGSSTTLTPSVKQQLTGEARFMRAFCYFYLVNLYGDVPLVISTDYKANAVLPRTPATQVYRQIIADLKNAQSLLSNNFLDGTLQNIIPERVRPTYWSATALLARAYLYTNAWDSSEIEASSIISNTGLFRMASLDSVFKKNNQEAIWQLQPVRAGANTPDALFYILPSSGPGINYPVYLSPFLLSAFESNDGRQSQWIDSVIAGGVTYYFPFKYRVNIVPSNVSEYSTVFRLAEQFLIRAEARAQLGKTSAVDDINTIRSRANLGNYSGATDKGSLLTAILHERQVEFFTEWGQRWLDLKRTGKADEIMPNVTQKKGGAWKADWKLYPIPLSELKANPNLVQNAGY
jgi:hypothetical protein